MNSAAQLLINDAPEQGPGARLYVIDCRWSYTATPAPAETIADLGDDRIARLTLFRHGLECGRCDESELWDRLIDIDPTEEEAAQVGQQLRWAYARGVRN